MAIKEKLAEYNEHPFQKLKGSRKSVFEEEEKEFLMPLPATPYETAVWSTATIQSDYLISVGESNYSVPYEFIGKRVDIRATEKVIEVFYPIGKSPIRAACSYSLISTLTLDLNSTVKLVCKDSDFLDQSSIQRFK